MKAFLNWSGGKDSAYCLYQAKKEGVPVEALVTTLHGDRISMHGVRVSLLQQQAAALQLPLHTITLPENPGMATYEAAIRESNRLLAKDGFRYALSGDLYLEDLKQYRKKLYEKDGLAALFPLWKVDTWLLLKDFIDKGFKALVVSVNGQLLDKSFCGRLIDDAFIRDLPPEVDPCGENGEYHSFVFDGPLFSKPVSFALGERVQRHYPSPDENKAGPVPFYFQDLLPAG